MSQSLTWNRKDLIDVEPLSHDEIETIFTAATAFKKAMEADNMKQPYLNGRTVVNLFLEPSTRTRLAFEVAANRLSADIITVTGSASGLTKERRSATPLATWKRSRPTLSLCGTPPPARPTT